jgi:hypothetical protein
LIVPIVITANSGKQISINSEIKNLPSNIKVYIEDRENSTFTDLASGGFSITLNTALNGIGRFYIHTTSSSLNTEDIKVNQDYINIYTTSENILKIAGLNDTANLTLHSIQGKEVLKTKINSTGLSSIELPELSKGIYIITLDSKTIQLSKKIIIN